MGREIRDILQEIVAPIVTDDFTVVGTAQVITQDANTGDYSVLVQPLDIEEGRYRNIKLQASPGNGVLMLPKAGSVVFIQLINEQQGYISLFSEVESIKWLDGSYGGLIKIADLVSKINDLESQVNDILTALKSHTHPETGSVTSPSTDFNGISNLPITDRDELENKNITHGEPTTE